MYNVAPRIIKMINNAIGLLMIALVTNCHEAKFYNIDHRFWGSWEAEVNGVNLNIKVPSEEKEVVVVDVHFGENKYKAELTYVEFIAQLIQFDWEDDEKNLKYRISVTFFPNKKTDQLEMIGIFERLSYKNKKVSDANFTKEITLRQLKEN